LHDSGEGDLGGLPGIDQLLVLGLHVWIESGLDQRGHVDSLADVGSAAAEEGATDPATRLSRHRRKACETCRLPRFEGAEFGHFDEQGEAAYNFAKHLKALK
jgi:hypothetical protein